MNIIINVFKQQNTTVEFNKKEGIITQAWSPNAQEIKDVFKNDKLQNITNKYDKTIAQVITKWLVLLL